MTLSDFAVDRRVTVMVLLLLLTVLGIYSAVTIPRESEPELIIPIASISVTYSGVAPQDMETLVTSVIERKMTGISGVKEIQSITAEGFANIVVEFNPDVDVDSAIQKVRDKVDLAKPDLPEDADDPVVRDMNTAETPVVLVTLTGAMGVDELTQIGEDLQDRIESLDGILSVELHGDVEREIQIEVDPARVAAYKIPLSDLLEIAIVENVNTPAGSLEVGEAKYLMRVPGEIRGPDDLRDLVVKQGEVGSVYMRDLAEIREGFKEPQSYNRLDRQSSVTLVATKRSRVNIIDVANNVKRVVEEAKATLPAGVDVYITLDESKRIDDMVWQLVNSILSGLILVLAVIFLFLGFANAIFVASAIPLSLLITFVVMDQVGMTLNMVTLFSLMVSLGMLVDNGIVVVENIYRHAGEGLSRVQAAKVGTGEVAWPIIGSTMTTVVAFAPMLAWPGMMGRFLSLLPKTVIITLFASLFVGLVINPALASIFMRMPRRDPSSQTDKRGHWILNAYEVVLRKALQWRMVTLVAAVTVMATILGIYATNPRFVFLTEIEPDRANINIDLPEGSRLDRTDEIARRIEDALEPELGSIDYLQTSVGSTGASVREGMPGAALTAGSSNIGRVTLVFPDWEEQTELPTDVIARIRPLFEDMTGAEVRITKTSMGPPSGAPVNIELAGEDFGVLASLTGEVNRRIKEIPGLVDLQDTLDKGTPEVKVVIDREQAALAGLSTQYIGTIVQAAVNGRKAGEYRVGDDEYDVTVKFPERFRKDFSYVDNMALINPSGQSIPFSTVARLEQGTGFGSIRRIDRKRTVSISAEAEDRLGTEVLADVQAALEDMEIPPGYTLRYTGEEEDVQESGQFLVRAFFVALFLIALVLITQFNSILQPLIIMSSVMLSIGGVFLGLLVFDMPFGLLMSGIGCISLAGIVVNNAIVLVDFINSLRASGLSAVEAIVTAGRTRFRPVMLTAVTTILGLMPLGIGVSFDFRRLELSMGGSQASYWGSMAVAIIFGLAFATVLTLIVVPVLYSLLVDFVGSMRKTVQTDTRPSEAVVK